MKFTSRNAAILWNGYNLSTRAYEYTSTRHAMPVEVTGMGDQVDNYVPGVAIGEATVNLWWDSDDDQTHDALSAPGQGILSINPNAAQEIDFVLTGEQCDYDPSGDDDGAIRAGSIRFVNSVHNPLSQGLEAGVCVYNGQISGTGVTPAIEWPWYSADASDHVMSAAWHVYSPVVPTNSSVALNGASVTGSSIDTGGAAWTSPTNINYDDAQYAHCQGGTITGRIEDTLLCTVNAGAHVPAGATILGYEVVVKRYVTLNNAQRYTLDYAVKLHKNGSDIGSNYANPNKWSATDEYITYGGPADTWGQTAIDVSDINNGALGVGIQPIQYKLSGGTDQNSWIDVVQTTVYYQTGLGLYDLEIQYSADGINWLSGLTMSDAGATIDADYQQRTVAYLPRYYRLAYSVASGSPASMYVYAHASARKA